MLPTKMPSTSRLYAEFRRSRNSRARPPPSPPSHRLAQAHHQAVCLVVVHGDRHVHLAVCVDHLQARQLRHQHELLHGELAHVDDLQHRALVLVVRGDRRAHCALQDLREAVKRVALAPPLDVQLAAAAQVAVPHLAVLLAPRQRAVPQVVGVGELQHEEAAGAQRVPRRSHRREGVLVGQHVLQRAHQDEHHVRRALVRVGPHVAGGEADAHARLRRSGRAVRQHLVAGVHTRARSHARLGQGYQVAAGAAAQVQHGPQLAGAPLCGIQLRQELNLGLEVAEREGGLVELGVVVQGAHLHVHLLCAAALRRPHAAHRPAAAHPAHEALCDGVGRRVCGPQGPNTG
mmetsp:Transcript_29289/g.73578  ORF Transcript_29289/g.73578 Transcript_29289/m.73578 type:complete len:346 (-) Transcript_29289:234-1271(-)